MTFNEHGCWFLVFRNSLNPATAISIEAFEALMVDCSRNEAGGEAPPDEIQMMADWAREAKPGALQAFYGATWIIAIDITRDDDGVLENIPEDQYLAWKVARPGLCAVDKCPGRATRADPFGGGAVCEAHRAEYDRHLRERS